MDRLKEIDPELFSHELLKNEFRHEHYSASLLKNIWKDRGYSSDAINLWAGVISLHHQKPCPHLNNTKPVSGAWKEAQEELEQEMQSIFLDGSKMPSAHQTDATGMLVTAILILMDWVSSSELFQTAEHMSIEDLKDLAEKALDLYGLKSDKLFPMVNSFQQLWPQIKNPRPLQSACVDLSPDALLSIIEAPMGEGKTEAALFLAAKICEKYQKRGIYMALPSQATSNQMYDRVNNMLAEINYGQSRLLHGTAFLIEDMPESFQSEDELIAAKWTRPTRMGLLGECAVGTVDQVMATILLTRFSSIRLAGLVNKVLIIDEIHAYDSYMSEIIETLLCWCKDLQIPVILLSATMQRTQKERYLSCYDVKDNLQNGYPLLTQVLPDGKMNQLPADASSQYYYDFVPVRIDTAPESIAEYAVRKIERGGCLGVLVNTVAEAQEIYRSILSKKTPDTETLLFHSRFTVGKRAEIEKKCVALFGKDRTHRPQRAILVATQVVEQSIDLDFDGMISALAPVDLLLQRAGRLHRHRGNLRPVGMEEPVLEVIVPDGKAPEALEKRYGRSGCVYDPFLLSNTEQELQTAIRVNIPEDIRPLIEKVYRDVTDKNRESWLQRMLKNRLEEAQAESCIWGKPEPDSFFPLEKPVYMPVSDQDDGFDTAGEASTRLGDNNIRVAFCNDEEFQNVSAGRYGYGVARSVYLKSAAVRLPIPDGKDPEKWFLAGRGKLAGIWCLNGTEKCTFGKNDVINDSVLGIRWEEKR